MLDASISQINTEVAGSQDICFVANQDIGQDAKACTDLLASTVEAESILLLLQSEVSSIVVEVPRSDTKVLQSDAVSFAANDDTGEHATVFTNLIHVNRHLVSSSDRPSLLADRPFVLPDRPAVLAGRPFVSAECPSPDYTDAYSVDDDEILAAFADIVDTGPYILPEDSDESSDDDHVTDRVANDRIVNSVGDDPTSALSNRFRNIDEVELQNVMKGGRRRSSMAENWARKAFDDFRQFKGYSTQLSIEDLSEAEDIVPLVDMLQLFMLQVAKRNGELYPPGTIANMLRAIGRIIRACQEQRYVESSSKPVLPFNILTDPRFHRVKLAADEAVIRGVHAGLGKETLKSDVLSRSEEKQMLDSNEASVKHPSGLNRRFAYFCTRNFFIRGGRELRDCESNLFEICKDHYGDEYLRFSPGLSKNWKVDVRHCSSDSLRKPVNCYDPDVISTYKAIVAHWPSFDPVNLVHPMFLTPRLRFKPLDTVWFTRGPVGRNTLSDITRTLALAVPALKLKKITNKSGRATGITRMEEACVLREKGMSITGHRDPKSYEKYSREESDLSSKVLQRVISGQGTSFKDISDDEVYRRAMMKVHDAEQVGNDAAVPCAQDTAGVSKHLEVPISTTKVEMLPVSGDHENTKILACEEGKAGHTFKENPNCQIINFVINGVLDSNTTATEILKSLGTVPFSSK